MDAQEVRAPGKRVLVVDDSFDTVRMMKLLLKRDGYDALTACDGPEAIEAAGRFLPQIVLLDLTLPGMGGREVAAELRKIEGLGDALIVAISGYGDGGIPPGCDHLMVKPVDHDALRTLLAGWTPTKSLAG